MPHVRGAAGRRLVGLMSTSALGGSLLLVLGAGPAVADNECGAYAPGAPVICSPEGGPYGRVTYRVPGELDVVLGDGARLEGGP